MSESGGIETPAAPEWLVRLESRREQIKAKLGHESGNGAPCVICGSKCPGLDLHFWRKVCRNCKCRKEQHDCKDDDVTGWAQFEILGAIRSKPAYIKISELTDKPVELDWIPPNVTPELASDYMSKLGQQNIPFAGSEAAEKRKQQLEYQVPPHDLDASLCHNLSENEVAQLVQYVEKIKKNCVGQGNVVRIGDNINYLRPASKHQVTVPIIETKQKENLLTQILHSEPIRAVLSGRLTTPSSSICLQKDPMEADFNASPHLSDKMKYKLKLMKLNSEAIKAAVEHGPELDQILNTLKTQNVPFQESCNILGPLDRLRHEYLTNPKFQNDIDKYVAVSTSAKPQTADSKFNSPLPVGHFARNERSQQHGTPARKLKFDKNQPAPFSNECLAAIKNDHVLANILNSEAVRAALHAPVYGSPLVICRKPMFPDFISSPFLSPATKAQLERMKINTQVIQSAVLHGPFYDEILSKLDSSGVNYAQDTLLQPIEEFRDEFLSYDSDNDFQKEIVDFVKNSDLSSFSASPEQIPEMAESRKMAQNTDQLLSAILSTPSLQNALRSGQMDIPLQISNVPTGSALFNAQKMSTPVLDKLNSMKIGQQALESAVVCGPLYDTLFHKLDNLGVNYADESLLGPIAQFRSEYLNDDNFRKELVRYITHPEPCLFDTATFEEIASNEQHVAKQLAGMHISHSDDSGFGSVPPTPNYSTYPGVLSPSDNIELQARDGVFVSVEDMNMYPEVRPDQMTRHEVQNESSVEPSQNLAPQIPEFITCSACEQTISFGEVVVKAERAGKKAAWHPQCFKCHECDELLADLVYFFHGGHVYCARDLANILKIPRCSACDELIFTKEYTAAEGATFHIKHFCCYHCDAPLAGQQYVPDEKSNMPLCLNCYDTFFAKACHYCHGTIGPAEQGVAWGSIHWHGSCFLCSGKGCGKSLIGGRFCVKNELPFCSPQCLRSIIS